MTISKIRVNASYCFGDEPLELNNLGKVNFIFAANGSGKSTISSALAGQPSNPTERRSWDVADTDLTIRVFNEAYRKQVLEEHVHGIFTVGKQPKEVNDKIESLTSALRSRQNERAKWKSDIGSNNGTSTGLQGDLQRERMLARDIVSEARSSVVEPARAIVFKGFRGNNSKLLDEALSRFPDVDYAPDPPTWEALNETARALEGAVVQRHPLPKVSTLPLITEQEARFLAASTDQTEGGDFSALIRRLNNEDWVSQGRDYLDGADGKCPFCQQEQPENLGALLADYFAQGFDAALAEATAISSVVQERAATLTSELEELEEALSQDPDIDQTPFTAAITAARRAEDLLSSKLNEKQQHPTRPVEAPDAQDSIDHLASLIEGENTRISNHNDLVANTKPARDQLVENGWNRFLKGNGVSAALKRFLGVEGTKLSKIEDLEARIDESVKEDDRARDQIAKLQRSISNTAEVARKINQLLEAMGFLRFKLEVESSVSGGYRIVREDGTIAVNTLSEGEKSFICFAYFWESLSGSSSDGTPAEDVVAVIDDPISSLDSDSLFIVASYVRDTANEVIHGNSNIRQLIVLTHNTQFHHEAAYTSNNRKTADRHYYRLVKRADGQSEVREDENKSKIRASYSMLWDAIVEAAKSNTDSHLLRVGIFNTARRIIEGYFKTVGQTHDRETTSSANPVDNRMVSTFLIWANAGSHTIVNDIDQTASFEDTERFLKLFRHFFDQQGHSAHFDMMVKASSGADLLKPGQIFERSDSESRTA